MSPPPSNEGALICCPRSTEERVCLWAHFVVVATGKTPFFSHITDLDPALFCRFRACRFNDINWQPTSAVIHLCTDKVQTNLVIISMPIADICIFCSFKLNYCSLLPFRLLHVEVGFIYSLPHVSKSKNQLRRGQPFKKLLFHVRKTLATAKQDRCPWQKSEHYFHRAHTWKSICSNHQTTNC